MAKGDSYLFTLTQEPDLKKAKIEGNRLHISVDLKRLPNPEVGGIEVEPSDNDGFVIRTYIKAIPERGWFPMLKWEDQIIELSKVTNNGPNFASYFEIEFKERKDAVAMAKNLATLFNVPGKRVATGEVKEAEAGSGQPATRSQSKSEGSQKPQPEAEEPKDDARANDQRLEQTDDKAKRVIAQLENIEVDDVSFEKLTTAEAMGYLTKKVVGNKGGGVIHFVIRGADQAKRVGITSKSLTFAKAVDEICRQSGRVWRIDFNETSGAPFLVFINKKDPSGPGK